MTPDELLQAYRRAAITHGEADDVNVVNAAHDELVEIRLALRDAGAARRILELLDDPSEHVRLWAGFDALLFSPADGVRVLQALASGPRGMVRFNAETTLSLYDKGELVLYPWETGEERTS